MVAVLWSTSITCSKSGCTWKTPMGSNLKEMLIKCKLHTLHAHPPTVRKSTATTTVEEDMKEELLSFLECPVCLTICKPPLQVYTICFDQY